MYRRESGRRRTVADAGLAERASFTLRGYSESFLPSYPQTYPRLALATPAQQPIARPAGASQDRAVDDAARVIASVEALDADMRRQWEGPLARELEHSTKPPRSMPVKQLSLTGELASGKDH